MKRSRQERQSKNWENPNGLNMGDLREVLDQFGIRYGHDELRAQLFTKYVQLAKAESPSSLEGWTGLNLLEPGPLPASGSLTVHVLRIVLALFTKPFSCQSKRSDMVRVYNALRNNTPDSFSMTSDHNVIAIRKKIKLSSQPAPNKRSARSKRQSSRKTRNSSRAVRCSPPKPTSFVRPPKRRADETGQTQPRSKRSRTLPSIILPPSASSFGSQSRRPRRSHRSQSSVKRSWIQNTSHTVEPSPISGEQELSPQHQATPSTQVLSPEHLISSEASGNRSLAMEPPSPDWDSASPGDLSAQSSTAFRESSPTTALYNGDEELSPQHQATPSTEFFSPEGQMSSETPGSRSLAIEPPSPEWDNTPSPGDLSAQSSITFREGYHSSPSVAEETASNSVLDDYDGQMIGPSPSVESDSQHLVHPSSPSEDGQSPAVESPSSSSFCNDADALAHPAPSPFMDGSPSAELLPCRLEFEDCESPAVEPTSSSVPYNDADALTSHSRVPSPPREFDSQNRLTSPSERSPFLLTDSASNKDAPVPSLDGQASSKQSETTQSSSPERNTVVNDTSDNIASRESSPAHPSPSPAADQEVQKKSIPAHDPSPESPPAIPSRRSTRIPKSSLRSAPSTSHASELPSPPHPSAERASSPNSHKKTKSCTIDSSSQLQKKAKRRTRDSTPEFESKRKRRSAKNTDATCCRISRPSRRDRPSRVQNRRKKKPAADRPSFVYVPPIAPLSAASVALSPHQEINEQPRSEDYPEPPTHQWCGQRHMRSVSPESPGKGKRRRKNNAGTACANSIGRPRRRPPRGQKKNDMAIAASFVYRPPVQDRTSVDHHSDSTFPLPAHSHACDTSSYLQSLPTTPASSNSHVPDEIAETVNHQYFLQSSPSDFGATTLPNSRKLCGRNSRASSPVHSSCEDNRRHFLRSCPLPASSSPGDSPREDNQRRFLHSCPLDIPAHSGGQHSGNEMASSEIFSPATSQNCFTSLKRSRLTSPECAERNVKRVKHKRTDIGTSRIQRNRRKSRSQTGGTDASSNLGGFIYKPPLTDSHYVAPSVVQSGLTNPISSEDSDAPISQVMSKKRKKNFDHNQQSRRPNLDDVQQSQHPRVTSPLLPAPNHYRVPTSYPDPPIPSSSRFDPLPTHRRGPSVDAWRTSVPPLDHDEIERSMPRCSAFFPQVLSELQRISIGIANLQVASPPEPVAATQRAIRDNTLVARIRMHVATLLGKGFSAHHKEFPPAATEAERALWKPIPDWPNVLGEDELSSQDSRSDRDLSLDLEEQDSSFPFAGGPGHIHASPQTLSIMWRTMRQVRVSSFRPDFSKSMNHKSNKPLWSLAFALLLRLCGAGEYNDIDLEIQSEQKIYDALTAHVKYLSRIFREASTMTGSAKNALMAKRRRVTRLSNCRKRRVFYLLSQPTLAPFIQVAQKCTSDDETDDESGTHSDDSSQEPGSKRVSILNMPWRHPRIQRMMVNLDKLIALRRSSRVKGSKPGKKLKAAGKTPTTRVRSHRAKQSSLECPRGLPADCYDGEWLKDQHPSFVAQLSIQPGPHLRSIATTLAGLL